MPDQGVHYTNGLMLTCKSRPTAAGVKVIFGAPPPADPARNINGPY
jgi:hypothetical protein